MKARGIPLAQHNRPGPGAGREGYPVLAMGEEGEGEKEIKRVPQTRIGVPSLTPPLLSIEQTDKLKILPSRRTSHAGGKYLLLLLVKYYIT